MRFVTAVLAALAAAVLLAAPLSAQEGRFVDVIEVTGVIDPPTSDFLHQALDRAQNDGAHASVIQLDTPGGLDVSMRDINQQILSSEIPVVVWVAPRGARAASAGTFIAYAAHLAYMAQATELGAATPINLGGEQPEELETKIVNDAVAYIQSLAEQRGRDAEFAEDAVREGASLPATEAAERNVITGVASSLRDLLQAIGSRSSAMPATRSRRGTTRPGHLASGFASRR
jgi:membrane-bound serine protease (ClpP class)